MRSAVDEMATNLTPPKYIDNKRCGPARDLRKVCLSNHLKMLCIFFAVNRVLHQKMPLEQEGTEG